MLGGKRENSETTDEVRDAPESMSLQKNILWNTVGSFVYLVCNWLVTVLVVILGGADASGSLAVGMAVGNIMATIVLFRARPVQVSDVRGDYTTGDFVMLRIVSSAVAIVFCLCYCVLTVSVQNYAPVAAYCLFKLIDSFVDVYHGVDQVHDRLDYAGISQILRGVLVVATFVGGMVVCKNLTIALLLMAASSLVVVLFYDVPRSAQFGSLTPEFSRGRLTTLFVSCVPGFAGSLIATMVVSLARQNFGMLHGNDLLGIYAAVATPTVIVQALASYIYAPLLGPIAEMWSEGRMRDVVSMLARVLLILAGVTCLGIVCGLLLGEPVLTLMYGEGIGSHADLLSAMLVCTAMSASMFFLIDMLIVFRDAIGSIAAAIAAFAACLLAMGPMLAEPDPNRISLLISVSYGIGVCVALAFIGRGVRRRRASQ